MHGIRKLDTGSGMSILLMELSWKPISHLADLRADAVAVTRSKHRVHALSVQTKFTRYIEKTLASGCMVRPLLGILPPYVEEQVADHVIA